MGAIETRYKIESVSPRLSEKFDFVLFTWIIDTKGSHMLDI